MEEKKRFERKSIVRFEISAEKKTDFPSGSAIALQPDEFYADAERKNVTNTTPSEFSLLEVKNSIDKLISRSQKYLPPVSLEQIEEDSGQDELDTREDISVSTYQDDDGSVEEDASCESGDPSEIYDSTVTSDTESDMNKDLSQPYSEYMKRFLKLKQTLQNWDKFLNHHGINKLDPNNSRILENRESLKQIFQEFKHIASRHQAGFLGVLLGDKTSGDNGISEDSGHDIKRVQRKRVCRDNSSPNSLSKNSSNWSLSKSNQRWNSSKRPSSRDSEAEVQCLVVHLLYIQLLPSKKIIIGWMAWNLEPATKETGHLEKLPNSAVALASLIVPNLLPTMKFAKVVVKELF
ncbi:unnamed protein product [Allacma fusca]|uniref:Uncharacterized protein n=1 Tax=Allacma fusca TaxID=39272 RepID=A0A8J2PZH5_9HEXA|nr:unnamed protein product [Allacma fusca]